MNNIWVILVVISLLGFGFVASSSATKPMAKDGFTSYDTLRLMGTEVKNPQGEVLGAISDFVFDQDGHIVFAILCHECYEDSPMAKDVAVPLSALRISAMKTNELKVVLHVDSKKLDAAPAYHFTQGVPDRRWAGNVYRYYGQQPLWTDEGSK
jgi:hypothetical protein